MAKRSIAILVTSFPNYSESFITDQINKLIEFGFDVTILARKFNKDVKLTNNSIKNKLIDKLVIYSEPVEMPQSIGKRLILAARILFTKQPHKSLFLKTFNPFKFGRKAFSLHYLFMLHNLQDYIKKNFDVAHAHFGQNGNLLADMQKLHLLKAKKTVVSFHGSDLHFHDAGYYRQLFSSDFSFTVNSKYMTDRILQMGAAHAEIIPMGVHEMFLGETRCEDKTTTVTMLTVARLIPVKGIAYGIRAVKKLLDEGINLHYVIIGDGPLLKELKQLVSELNITDHVQFAGSKTQEELLDYYRKSDIFLLPGITTEEGAQEAQGLVVLEAQAMKLPVIVTDAGGMSEGMINDITGFVVPQKNPEALAIKIKELVYDKHKRKEMGEAGRKFVHNNFDSKKLVKKLVEEVYQL